jgi:hypothetical protein
MAMAATPKCQAGEIDPEPLEAGTQILAGIAEPEQRRNHARPCFRHLAIAHLDDAAAAAGETAVVGDEQKRRAFARLQIEEQVDDRFTRVLVEIAGGFVGEDDLAPAARARAMATRCCSPPESCPG